MEPVDPTPCPNCGTVPAFAETVCAWCGLDPTEAPLDREAASPQPRTLGPSIVRAGASLVLLLVTVVDGLAALVALGVSQVRS